MSQNSPIVNGLLHMLDSANGQTPEGKRLAIEIAQSMEIESNKNHRDEVNGLKQDKLVLGCNIQNKERMITSLTEENGTLRQTLAAKEQELTRLRGDIQMYRSTNAFEKQLTLSSENEMLRENLAATDKELKRLHKDLQVYRSIHAFEQQLSGEGSSAAKRPRADSPEGSGAQP